MIKNLVSIALLTIASGAAWLTPMRSVAQNQAPAAARGEEAPPEIEYTPPVRSAPGGRVGGETRGTVKATGSLPTIELLAPDGHVGLTTTPTPDLYFFVSQPIIWPIQFTIRAPRQPRPVVEVNIPAPRKAGVYALRTADYDVRLTPSVIYTWSVSVILNPKARSRDIVASASLLRSALDPAIETSLRAAPVSRRAALFAKAGLWYDAVAAAVAMEAFDRHAALDALMKEVDLVEAVAYDQQTTWARPSR